MVKKIPKPRTGSDDFLSLEHNKVLQRLAACTLAERDALRLFLASPYHNRKDSARALYEFIEGRLQEKQLSKQAISQWIWPGSDFDDKRLRYCFSELGLLIERFWVVEHALRQEKQGLYQLMEIAVARKQEKVFQALSRQMDDQLASNLPDGAEGFLMRHRLAELEERRFQTNRVRKPVSSLETATYWLDCFYYVRRLSYACALLDRQAIVNAQYESGISASWIALMHQSGVGAEPLVHAYYMAWRMLQAPGTDEDFTAFKQSISALSGPYPHLQEHLRELYTLAINFCARKIRQGEPLFVEEALALYTQGIENHIFLERGELSPWTFTNVIKLALRLNRFEWASHFIDLNQDKLPQAFRQNAVHFNRAELFYYTQNPDQALFHLNKVNYSDMTYYLGARILLLKIYYEQGEEKPLLSLLASFMMFLKRQRDISAEIKNTYLNFCILLQQLHNKKVEKLKEFDETIRTTALLTDRAWLIQQWQRRNAKNN